MSQPAFDPFDGGEVSSGSMVETGRDTRYDGRRDSSPLYPPGDPCSTSGQGAVS